MMTWQSALLPSYVQEADIVVANSLDSLVRCRRGGSLPVIVCCEDAACLVFLSIYLSISSLLCLDLPPSRPFQTWSSILFVGAGIGGFIAGLLGAAGDLLAAFRLVTRSGTSAAFVIDAGSYLLSAVLTVMLWRYAFIDTAAKADIELASQPNNGMTGDEKEEAKEEANQAKDQQQQPPAPANGEAVVQLAEVPPQSTCVARTWAPLAG